MRKCPTLNSFWFTDECIAYQFLSFGVKLQIQKIIVLTSGAQKMAADKSEFH